MKGSFDQLPRQVQDQIAESFSALEEAAQWSQEASTTALARRGVGLPELYAFAQDPGIDSNGRIRMEMRRNRRLGRIYSALLDDLGAFRFDKLAAAAAGVVMERSNPDKGYRMRLIESSSEQGEVHLVIDFELSRGANFRHLHLIDVDGDFEVLELDPGEMPIHLLLEPGSRALMLLQKPDTELKFL